MYILSMKEQSVSATDFKRDCLKLISEVERTRVPVRVTRRGKVVARLMPASDEPMRSLAGSVAYDREDDLLAPTGETWNADT